MAFDSNNRSELVEEVVETLLTKFQTLPTVDRSLIVIASIEAIAWLASMESVSHCKKLGENDEHLQDRMNEYKKVFATCCDQSTPKSLDT